MSWREVSCPEAVAGSPEGPIEREWMTSELIRMGPRWAAAAAGAILFCAVVVAKPAGPLPKWLPDGKYTARLAPVFRVGTHTVRPPAGYTLVTNELTGGAGSQYSWIGPRRLDDSHANFQMHVIHIPPEEQSQKAAYFL